MIHTPALKFENDQLYILDQTFLPQQMEYLLIQSAEQAFEAIQSLRVRGAPAIGIMAAYTLYIAARNFVSLPLGKFKLKLIATSNYLLKSRPTAVNLSWAIQQIQDVIQATSSGPVEKIVESIRQTAIRIHEEDRDACYRIGRSGLRILSDPCRVITHCNTGSLATGGWGTALGVIYAAIEKNYDIHVYVCETRPLGQGARLTFWELQQHKVPSTLITDSTAAFIMQREKINAVIFGADRISSNGDVANKIGSYSLAVAAYYHNIPCYVAAPFSTFDLSLTNGIQIPIEERNKKEILQIYHYNNNLSIESNVYNPAFDVTPAHLISGIITEHGILSPPLSQAIKNLHKQILR